jgi:hypothetical protein
MPEPMAKTWFFFGFYLGFVCGAWLWMQEKRGRWNH